MAHTAEADRHPMEGTEDSAGIKESFKKKNADEWTKERQKKENNRKRRNEAHLNTSLTS